jgi:hypothetical protein
MMDITPSKEFCAACRIVLGGDTPNIVIPALRTNPGDEIQRINAEIVDGKRVVQFPLDPPAGTLNPPPHMLEAVQKAVEAVEEP